MMIKTVRVSFATSEKQIIREIDIEVATGEFVGIIGPNGSGKSTLLKNIYKVLHPSGGSIFVGGKEIQEMSYRDLANELAVVSQENNSNFDFTVTDIVLMGTYPKKKLFESSTKKDLEKVKQVLSTVGLSGFEERYFLNLSGGEKQRAIIARALIQDTEILVLDEPTNHLDIGAQIKTLDLIKSMNKTTITALHDLNIAAKYCNKLYVMKKGELIASGTPRDVITSELVEELYEIKAEVKQIGDMIHLYYV